MDKTAVLKTIEDFRVALEQKGVRVKRIVLFGSYATGTATRESDIDLVVISPDFSDKDLWARIEILSEAVCRVWSPIEAIASTPEEWEEGDSLALQFARQGEVVFAAA